VQKLKSVDVDVDANDEQTAKAIDEIQKNLTPEESEALDALRGRKMLRHEDAINVDNFTKDSINGLVAVMERGKLGLKKGEAAKVSKASLFSLGFLEGHGPDMDKMMTNKKQPEKASDVTNGHTNGHTNVANGTEKASDATNGHVTVANGTHELNGAPKTGGTGFDKLLHPVLSEGLSLDEASRHFLINTFHEAAEKLETPHDTMRRFADSVCYHPTHK
jgi:hypothetical protein